MSRKFGNLLERIFSKRTKPEKSRVIYKYWDGKVYKVYIEDGAIIKEEIDDDQRNEYEEIL